MKHRITTIFFLLALLGGILVALPPILDFLAIHVATFIGERAAGHAVPQTGKK